MSSAVAPPEFVLTPRSNSWPARIGEVWRDRTVVYFLAWRDLKVRYKQTALGAAWAVLQPLLMMIVITGVVGRVSRPITETEVPYVLFTYGGLLIWTYFSNSVTNASMGLVANPVLVTKMYLPRASLVVAPLLASLVDLAIGGTVLAALMAWYGTFGGLQALLLPAFVAWVVLAGLGLGLWLAALNVRYRDIRYAVPFLIQLGLFLTPVFYRTSSLHGVGRLIYSFNPLVGGIEGFRWSLLGTPLTPLPALAGSFAVTSLALMTGAWYFHRTERFFADVI